MATSQKAKKPRPGRPGGGKAGAAARRAAFVDGFLSNGHNATQAAITAGYSRKTAYSTGQRLLKHVEISGQLAERARDVAEASDLEAKRELREAGRLSRSDVRRIFRADGTLKDPHEWDDDTAAAIASIEVIEQFEGTGEDRKLSGYLKKVRLWDKNAALEKTIKHLGLYEKDNAQRGESLEIKIELV
jgi:phage terminase small subunit